MSRLLFAITALFCLGAVVLRGIGAFAEGSLSREALYASIRDLEDDFETGKLSAEDHAALRDELRARAVALAQREREQARVAPAAAPAPVCARCGSGLRTGDRFCAQCGAPVAAPPEREASA